MILQLMLTLLMVQNNDIVDKQRLTAKTNLGSARIKVTFDETDSLLVYTTLPQAATVALAKDLQQTFAAAQKQLDFGLKEEPYKGKLTVIVLNDARDFKNYILRIERKPPPRTETQFFALDSETPTILIGVPLGSRTNVKELMSDAATWVAAAVLQAKLGSKTDIPTWLKESFGTMIALHRPGNERALATHRNSVLTLYKRSNGKAFQSTELTVESLGQYSNIVHTSALESLAYGSWKEKFLPFVLSFRTGETDAPKSFYGGLQALTIDWNSFDAGWRKWIVTGK